MASTAEGARITDAKLAAQLAVARATQHSTALLWAVLDPADLDRTSDRWARAQLEVILAGRARSARTAVDYYRWYRLAEIGEAPDLPDPPHTPDRGTLEAIRTSLHVTGPVRVKTAVAAGRSTTDAMRHGLAGVTNATQRHVLNAGRDTDLFLMDADPKVTRYARVTDGNACAFCGMLAGRGAVYLSDLTAGRKVHDGCGCGVEPVFEDTLWKPPRSTADWSARWYEYADNLPKGGRLSAKGFARWMRANPA